MIIGEYLAEQDVEDGPVSAPSNEGCLESDRPGILACYGFLTGIDNEVGAILPSLVESLFVIRVIFEIRVYVPVAKIAAIPPCAQSSDLLLR